MRGHNLTPKEFYSYFPDKKEYYLVIEYFLFTPDDEFKKVLNHMCEGISFSDGVKGVFFKDAFEPDDEEYFEDGILYSFHEEYVVVDYHTSYQYIKIACDIYLSEYEGESDEINMYLDKFRKRYLA